MNGIRAEHLTRSYTMGENIIKAVDDISFTIPEGKYTIILGASGAGKSTVLNLLGGMDSPTGGRLWVAGQEISGYNKRQLAEYRRNNIGFVFQFYNLMANLTMLENVELASQICRNPLNAKEVLEPSAPAASSSGAPSPAPWPKIQISCCAMNPPARWTTKPENPSWRCCTNCAARAAKPWSW